MALGLKAQRHCRKERQIRPVHPSLPPQPSPVVRSFPMKITLNLSFIGARVAVFCAALVLAFGFIGFAMMRFVTSVVSSSAFAVNLPALEAAAVYFPNSAKVQARLAARLVESELDATESHETLSERAFQHASRAVILAPANYEYRVLLAAAAELQGKLAEAEEALRAAIQLAPNNVNVRWQMANLLLRLGKNEESLAEFRFVADADPARMQTVFNLVWQATNGDLQKLNQVAGDEPSARLALAQFLVGQSQFEASAEVFSRIERNSRLQSPESGKLIDAFLKASQWEWANKLWRATLTKENETERALVWNGSFERPQHKGLTHFDWQLNNSNYARLTISSGGSRTGQRALRLAYLGKETTRLENEAQQLLLLKPGATYRLECFAKPEKLAVSDGPQIAVLRSDNRSVIAATSTVSAGVADWQLLTVDFVVPADRPAVVIAIKQTPRYSYVEPPKGFIWFDDFTLHAL